MELTFEHKTFEHEKRALYHCNTPVSLRDILPLAPNHSSNVPLQHHFLSLSAVSP